MHYFSPFKKIGRNLKLDCDQKKNGRYLEKKKEWKDQNLIVKTRIVEQKKQWKIKNKFKMKQNPRQKGDIKVQKFQRLKNRYVPWFDEH